MSDVDDYTRRPIMTPQEVPPHDPHGKPFSAETIDGKYRVEVPHVSLGSAKESTGRTIVTMRPPMAKEPSQ